MPRPKPKKPLAILYVRDVPARLVRRLDRIAQVTGRPRKDLAAQALRMLVSQFLRQWGAGYLEDLSNTASNRLKEDEGGKG